MKIGIYSVTFLGAWYRGEAMTLEAFMRYAADEGWEGVELDTKRPHAAPMDLSADDRKALRDLAGELNLPISAVSPNCDLSSPVPEHREAMICYVRECIKLTRDLGSPLCKIFAAWRGLAVRKGLADYAYTREDRYPDWADTRWGFVMESLKELAAYAEDIGITLALQNHQPVTAGYQDVLSFIEAVDSPALKACMDLPNEDEKGISPDWARQVVRDTGDLQVHTHYNGELYRRASGEIALKPNLRQTAYGPYVKALVESGYGGFMNWEFCHPAVQDGEPAGRAYVHEMSRLALEYMKDLRDKAER